MPLYARIVPGDSTLSLTREWLDFATQAISRRIVPDSTSWSGRAHVAFKVTIHGVVVDPRIALTVDDRRLARSALRAVAGLGFTHTLPRPTVGGHAGDAELVFEVRAGGSADGWYPVPRVPTSDLKELRVATAAPGNRPPPYPVAMRQQNIQGKVLVSFVVDTEGRADLSSVVAEEFPHFELLHAVVAHLPAMRYRPAMLGDCRTPMWVSQPFAFAIKYDE